MNVTSYGCCAANAQKASRQRPASNAPRHPNDRLNAPVAQRKKKPAPEGRTKPSRPREDVVQGETWKIRTADLKALDYFGAIVRLRNEVHSAIFPNCQAQRGRHAKYAKTAPHRIPICGQQSMTLCGRDDAKTEPADAAGNPSPLLNPAVQSLYVAELPAAKVSG